MRRSSHAHGPVLFCAAVLVFAAGCAYEGDFVKKSEAELKAMEATAVKGSQLFHSGQYQEADKVFTELGRERTVSQPLYQYEKISILLLQGKYDEAHDRMLKLKNDLDFVTDKQLEDKAASLWHGEQNKVFKGDPYERSTLHAFLALSFLRKGDPESALSCVKSGLLFDADTEKGAYASDYALLYFIGAMCHQRLGNFQEAMRFQKEAIRSLSARQVNVGTAPDGQPIVSGTCFDPFLKDCNTVLVLWAGTPPTMIQQGEYKEDRQIVGGTMTLDSLVLAYGSPAERFLFPRYLADINFQALTRGNRMMNDILKEKALWKLSINVTSTVLFTTGVVLLQTGNTYMMIAGGSCMAAGTIGYIVAWCINPEADIRHWKNLPGELIVLPMKLPPGRQCVSVTGYLRADKVITRNYEVDIRGDLPLNVVHIQMDKGAMIPPGIFQNNMQMLAVAAFSAATSVSPMQYEIDAKQVENIRATQGSQLQALSQEALQKARSAMIQSTWKE
ncbi:MAG: Tetratricopeptide repeat protein [Lentisphaerae bacterium ADurb.Bin242]|nr:MAG: Tetratricopeptide repeat protein [Lentisphaerae bacterium ADurb.Bin242]